MKKSRILKVVSISILLLFIPVCLWLISFNFISGYVCAVFLAVCLTACFKFYPLPVIPFYLALFIIINIFLLPNSLKIYDAKRISYSERIFHGNELLFHEKFSIYGLNLVMSFFGSPFYPEASRETFLLAFDHKDNREYFYSKFFLKSPKIQNIIKSDLRNKEFKITWNTSDYAFGHVESRYALALNPCVLKIETDGSKIKYSVIVRIEYPAKAEIVLLKYPFRVVVEEGLFNYLQKIKWLHPYEAVWIYEENR